MRISSMSIWRTASWQDFVESLLNTYEYVPKVKVFVFNQMTFSGIIYKESDIVDDVWKQEVIHNTSTSILWSIHHVDDMKIWASKALRNRVNNSIYGIISLEITPDYLFGQLKNLELLKTGNTYVIDDQGNIFFKQDELQLKQGKTRLEHYPNDWTESSGFTKQKLNREDFIVIHDKMKNRNWTLVGEIPLESVPLISVEVKNYIIKLSIWLIILGFIVIYIISNFFTKRLVKLTDEMFKVSRGDLEIKVDIRGNDEIGQMNKVFQMMMRKLNKNIDEISEMKTKEFELQMKALQAQINPHFLYNTLSTINWMAMGAGNENISTAINELAKYYRIALSNGEKEIITIQEELNHVSAYIYIQQIRINGNISFEFVVDDEALVCLTPKMILQPIVENAIYHGIEKHKKTGSIVISIKMRNQHIHIK